MALTRIKSDNILDREVRQQDLADGAVTFNKIGFISGGNSGDVLTVDAFGNLIFAPASGAPTTIDALVDVDTTGALDGDSLVFNLGTGQWEPGSNVPSSLGLNSLIDTTITAPGQKHVLQYVGTEWINSPLSADEVIGIAAVALSNDFGDLSNVDLSTAPTIGQTIRWVGDRFVPGDLTDFGSIDNFDDVDTSTTPPVNGQVLAFDGLLWVPQTVGGVGTTNATYVVADIVARDALSPAVGDTVFVRDTTDGTGTAEWSFFLWEGAVYVEISSEDSSRSDANTMEAVVYFNSSTPVLIGNVSDDSRVTNVTIEIVAAFDGSIDDLPSPTPPAFFSVGDIGDNARLIDDSAVDWGATGSYVCNLDYVYDGTEQPDTNDTDIFAYFDFTGSTTGEARIIVTHV